MDGCKAYSDKPSSDKIVVTTICKNRKHINALVPIDILTASDLERVFIRDKNNFLFAIHNSVL